MHRGEEGEIICISAKGEIRKRLLDLGVMKGSAFKIMRKAPLGDPIEIKINNFYLSLRLEEAELVHAKKMK